MIKETTITKKKGEILFLIREYQATLWFDTHKKIWMTEYFRKSHSVLISSNNTHPVMPRSFLDQPRAEEITNKVLGLLYAGKPVTKDSVPPVTKARPSRSKTKAPKVATAFQVIDHLLNLADDTCTVLVPMGTQAALKTSKVRIVDSDGETICEVPYPIFEYSQVLLRFSTPHA